MVEEELLEEEALLLAAVVASTVGVLVGLMDTSTAEVLAGLMVTLLEEEELLLAAAVASTVGELLGLMDTSTADVLAGLMVASMVGVLGGLTAVAGANVVFGARSARFLQIYLGQEDRARDNKGTSAQCTLDFHSAVLPLPGLVQQMPQRVFRNIVGQHQDTRCITHPLPVAASYTLPFVGSHGVPMRTSSATHVFTLGHVPQVLKHSAQRKKRTAERKANG